MDAKHIISEYIKTSRLLTDVYHYEEERYTIPYDKLSKEKDVPFDYPELVLCYSLKKTCEHITINGGDSFLIFDVAIGRFMNNMNALVLGENVSKANIEMFIKKGYAEAFFSKGNLFGACINKLYVDQIKKRGEESEIKKDLMNPKRILMVLLQELFILFHEVSHFRLAKIPREEYRKIIDNKQKSLKSNDVIINLVNKGLIGKYAQMELEDIQKDDYRHLLVNSGSDITNSDFWEGYYTYLQNYYDDIKNVEEIICDEFAMFSLLKQVKPLLLMLQSSGLSCYANIMELFYSSCYMALQNLNYLVKIDNNASRFYNGVNDTEATNDPYPFYTLPDVQKRKSCLVTAIIKHEEENNPDKKDLIGPFWSTLAVKLSKKYNDFEEVFQGHYTCCDRNKLFQDISLNKDDDVVAELMASSLETVLQW